MTTMEAIKAATDKTNSLRMGTKEWAAAARISVALVKAAKANGTYVAPMFSDYVHGAD